MSGRFGPIAFVRLDRFRDDRARVPLVRHRYADFSK